MNLIRAEVHAYLIKQAGSTLLVKLNESSSDRVLESINCKIKRVSSSDSLKSARLTKRVDSIRLVTSNVLSSDRDLDSLS